MRTTSKKNVEQRKEIEKRKTRSKKRGKKWKKKRIEKKRKKREKVKGEKGDQIWIVDSQFSEKSLLRQLLVSIIYF